MPPRRLTAEPPPLVANDPVPPGPPVNAPPGMGYEQTGSFMAPPEVFPNDDQSRIVVGTSASEQITELTDEERALFATLMGTGRMSKTLDVMGHEVVVETLNTDDDLRVGLFAKPYLGTEAHERAWQVGTCAAGVRLIGGRPLYTTLSAEEGTEAIFDAKVTKLLKFYPIVVTEMYRAILSLDLEFAELATKLGKLKG